MAGRYYQPIHDSADNDASIIEMKSSPHHYPNNNYNNNNNNNNNNNSYNNNNPNNNNNAPLFPILQPAIPIAYPSNTQPQIVYAAIPQNNNNNNHNNPINNNNFNNNNIGHPSAIPVAAVAGGIPVNMNNYPQINNNNNNNINNNNNGNNFAPIGGDQGMVNDGGIPSIDQLEWIAKRRHAVFDVRDILSQSYSLVQHNCFSSLLLLLFILFIIGILFAILFAAGLSTIINDINRHHHNNTDLLPPFDGSSSSPLISNDHYQTMAIVNNHKFNYYHNNNNINIKNNNNNNVGIHSSILPSFNTFFPTAGFIIHSLSKSFSYDGLQMNEDKKGIEEIQKNHHHHHRRPPPPGDRMRDDDRDNNNYYDNNNNNNNNDDDFDPRAFLGFIILAAILLSLLQIFLFIPLEASIQSGIITAIQKNSYISFSNWFSFLLSGNLYRPFLWFSFCWFLLHTLISIIFGNLSFIITFFFMFSIPLRLQYPSLPVKKCISFSFHAVKNHFCQLLLLSLACILMQIIGALMCIVGLFFTIPMAIAAPIFAYHAIFGIHSMRNNPLLPVAPVIHPYQQYAAIPINPSPSAPMIQPQQHV